MSNSLNHPPHLSVGRGDVRSAASSLDRPLRGVIVPLVTPLTSRDDLDILGLDRLVEYVIRGGVHGLFLLGTTGESAALCGRVRRELVTRVCETVRGRVPVLVGISDTAVAESLRLADDAARTGADAVVITAPYYLPVESSELVNYIRMVSCESSLPVFLYNMPELTKSWFSPEVLDRLLDVENVVGLKDSSGDVGYFNSVRKLTSRRPDWSLLIGSEDMMANTTRDGAHGAVAGGANVWPKLFVDLYEAALVHDEKLVAALQEQVLALAQLYGCGGYAVGTIRGIKGALSQMGICGDLMADPFLPVNGVQREAIAELLQRLGLLDQSSPNGAPLSRFDTLPSSGRVCGSPSAPAKTTHASLDQR